MSESKKTKRKTFDSKVHKVLGDSFKPKDFKDDPDMSNIDTPTYKMYQDDDNGNYTPILDIDKADPNTFNCYIGTKVELSIGDQVMTGKVQCHKREPDGSLKGMANQHSILDTCTKLNSQMDRLRNTLQMSLPKICTLSVMLRGISTYYLTRSLIGVGTTPEPSR
jgi:hypothetical protein